MHIAFILYRKLVEYLFTLLNDKSVAESIKGNNRVELSYLFIVYENTALLDKAGVGYIKLLAEENAELVTALGKGGVKAVAGEAAESGAKKLLKALGKYGVLNIGQEMLEEGIARGRAEGLAEGMIKGKAEGLAEGLAKGIRENQLSTARKMLKLGMAIEEISEITGLTKEEISSL